MKVLLSIITYVFYPLATFYAILLSYRGAELVKTSILGRFVVELPFGIYLVGSFFLVAAISNILLYNYSNLPFGTKVTNFVTQIGPRHTLKITDMSGSIPTSGASIVIKTWDAAGTAISESEGAEPLKLYSRSAIVITGTSV